MINPLRQIYDDWAAHGRDWSKPGFRALAIHRLGKNVDVGLGAKTLGLISVGDAARIGANAVVLKDVPAGALAIGVPAPIVGSGQAPPAC